MLALKPHKNNEICCYNNKNNIHICNKYIIHNSGWTCIHCEVENMWNIDQWVHILSIIYDVMLIVLDFMSQWKNSIIFWNQNNIYIYIYVNDLHRTYVMMYAQNICKNDLFLTFSPFVIHIIHHFPQQYNKKNKNDFFYIYFWRIIAMLFPS